MVDCGELGSGGNGFTGEASETLLAATTTEYVGLSPKSQKQCQNVYLHNHPVRDRRQLVYLSL